MSKKRFQTFSLLFTLSVLVCNPLSIFAQVQLVQPEIEEGK